MKSYLITAVVSLIITAVIMSFEYGQVSLIAFVNSGAMTGILFFVLGCIIYVAGGGFFNATLYSMKVFYKKMTRQGRMIAEAEGDEDEFEQRTFKTPFTYPLLAVGIGLFLLTLVLSYATT